MTWEQITALVGVLGGVVLGVLGYRRSRQVDATSAQAGMVTEARAGTAQIIGGLNALLDQVQEDNQDFRTELRHCAARVLAVEAERDACRREFAEYRRQNNHT